MFQPRTMPAGLLLLPLLACGDRAGTSVEAPMPAVEFAAAGEALPPVTPGTIVAPIALDVHGALAALEEAVPTRFGSINDRKKIGGKGRKSFAFEVRREPFTVTFAGDTLLLSAVIHYKGRGWYDPPIGPDLNGECGTSDRPPRARLAVRLIPSLTPDWQLKVATRAVRVTPLSRTERDQCEVTFLKINVTDRVLEAAEGALRRVLPRLSRRLAQVDLRSPLERIWVDLQQPIRVTDSLWLVLQPTDIHLGLMSGNKQTVGADVGITAAPRILSGERPVVASIPLPRLGPITEGSGFSVLVEGNFDFGVMSGVLTSKLRGKSVRAAGGTLEVRKVTVIGVGQGRLAIGVDFGGTAQGRLWLTGSPRYEPATGLITVPDLDFDAASAGMLVQGVAWLKGDAIREFLRSQAQVPAGELMTRLEHLAVKEMNRELRPGVRLGAEIASSEPAGILVRQDGLVIRARALGNARLDLGPELFAPKDSVP